MKKEDENKSALDQPGKAASPDLEVQQQTDQGSTSESKSDDEGYVVVESGLGIDE